MNANYTPGQNEETSIGMNWKTAVVLGYIFSLVGLIFFFIEKKSAFLRFHFAQAGVIFAAYFVLGILNVIPIIGTIISGIGCLVVFIFMIIAVINAAKGEWYRIPLLADLADWACKNINA